jgi:hypothetical protein
MVTAKSCSCSCNEVAGRARLQHLVFSFSDQSGPDWANCGHSLAFGCIFNLRLRQFHDEERKRKEQGYSMVFRLVGHPRAHYDHARESIKDEVYIAIST